MTHTRKVAGCEWDFILYKENGTYAGDLFPTAGEGPYIKLGSATGRWCVATVTFFKTVDCLKMPQAVAQLCPVDLGLICRLCTWCQSSAVARLELLSDCTVCCEVCIVCSHPYIQPLPPSGSSALAHYHVAKDAAAALTLPYNLSCSCRRCRDCILRTMTDLPL